MTDNGKIVRGLKSTYKRHGTLNLFAALEIATGAIHTKTTQYKKRVDFLSFMDDLVSETSPETEIHVIMDNYCIHKKMTPGFQGIPMFIFTLHQHRQAGLIR